MKWHGVFLTVPITIDSVVRRIVVVTSIINLNTWTTFTYHMEGREGHSFGGQISLFFLVCKTINKKKSIALCKINKQINSCFVDFIVFAILKKTLVWPQNLVPPQVACQRHHGTGSVQFVIVIVCGVHTSPVNYTINNNKTQHSKGRVKPPKLPKYWSGINIIGILQINRAQNLKRLSILKAKCSMLILIASVWTA